MFKFHKSYIIISYVCALLITTMLFVGCSSAEVEEERRHIKSSQNGLFDFLFEESQAPNPAQKPRQELDKGTASELISKWYMHAFFGCICDVERAPEYIDQYMTDFQKDEFCIPYEISCCKNLKEINIHSKKYFTDKYLNEAPLDSRYVFNYNGKMYICITPGGYGGFDGIDISKISDDKYEVSAYYYDIDGSTYSDSVFDIKYIDGSYKIDGLIRNHS